MKQPQTATTIKVGGKSVDIALARVLYRCKVCLSKLDYWNNGLTCITDRTHRGYIHRDQGGKQLDELSTQVQELEEKIWKQH